MSKTAAPACQLVRVQTEDGIELQGLYFAPNCSAHTAILHTHAWAGNFYENRFIDHLAAMSTERDIGFLTLATRGAGHVQDYIVPQQSDRSYRQIGGSLERFEDCLLDIDAGMQFLRKLGIENIILEGHSSACQKSLHYAAQRGGIRAIVLLEPTDDVAYTQRLLGVAYHSFVAKAKQMASSGDGDSPLSASLGIGVGLSAKRFLSMCSSSSTEGSMLHIKQSSSPLHNLGVPVLLISGDRSIYQDAIAIQQYILEHLPSTTCHIVHGANHWFDDHETQLSNIISSWLTNTAPL